LFLGLFFHPEDLGDVTPKRRLTSTDYAALRPRRQNYFIRTYLAAAAFKVVLTQGQAKHSSAGQHGQKICQFFGDGVEKK
jgi:hypothetical protein